MNYIDFRQRESEMKYSNKIEKKYYPAIGRILSPIVLDKLSNEGNSNYLHEVISNSNFSMYLNKNMSLADFFDFTYNFCLKNYRNEYVYKNAITNKILLGRHSLNTSTLLTEFRVGSCKADAVILNGSSTVYEIKSKYDTFNRLENQIEEYLKVFDNVNVISEDSQIDKLKKILPKNVGILTLTKRNTISVFRQAVSNKKNVDPAVIFDSLRKSEYLNIINKVFGSVPKVPNTQIFKECKSLFVTLENEIAHDLMVAEIKKRIPKEHTKDIMSKIPQSLSAYALSSTVKKGKKSEISKLIPN
ncbi:MAG: sce7726 family protein, partial [Candidatus Delongbacteria bacterium]|nr:sce7726 family protein [Candidatus Delongbacteria bacterium]